MKKEAAEKKEAMRLRKKQLAADELIAKSEAEEKRIQKEKDDLAFDEANTCDVCYVVIKSPHDW